MCKESFDFLLKIDLPCFFGEETNGDDAIGYFLIVALLGDHSLVELGQRR